MLDVVEGDPGLDGGLGLLKRLEVVLPYTFLLERAKEALDHPVLLWGVRRDELLAQTVLFAARLEMFGSEHLAVVALQLRALLSAQIHLSITRQADRLIMPPTNETLPNVWVGSIARRRRVDQHRPRWRAT